MSAMKVGRALRLSGSLSALFSPGISELPASLLLSTQALLRPVSAQNSARAQQALFSTWTREPWVCAASVPSLRSHYSTSTSEPHFTYRISASYSAKAKRLDPERNLFNFDPFIRINRSATSTLERRNRPRSGQDAYFVNQVGDTGTLAFGVVDGVGGWQDSGVDPADFAHSLCEYMAGAANTFPEKLPQGPLHPRDLLQFGYSRVVQDKKIEAGGSTACVATAEPNGHVEIANLGDSGFIHFGVNAVRYVSDPQTHAFNTPFQLSKIPRKQLQQMADFGMSTPLADLPKDANVTHHTVSHGDILVFATDGVWDNLSPQDALTIVGRYMIDMGAWVDTGKGLEIAKDIRKLTEPGALAISKDNTLQALLALAVTREAKEASLNQRRDGPFAREVQRYYPGENWHGGKPDDICVVVAIALKD